MTQSLRIFTFLLVLLFSVAVKAEAKTEKTKVKTVGVKTFKRQLSKTDVLLIDVRTPEEFNDGHIKNAKLVNFKSDNFKEESETLPKNKTICVYCRSGHRSGLAVEVLRNEGFPKIYNLNGGINKWIDKGMEVVK